MEVIKFIPSISENRKILDILLLPDTMIWMMRSQNLVLQNLWTKKKKKKIDVTMTMDTNGK